MDWNHPDGYQSTTSTGSNKASGDPDGLMLFTYYPVRQAITVYGLEVALASNTVEADS